MTSNNPLLQTEEQPKDILIIDDTPQDLRLLSNILDTNDYHIRRFSQCSFALESAKTFPPSLIILDIMMPEMSGYEACNILKQDQRTSDVPVIFISALGDVSDKVKGFACGGVDFITKPFRSEEVLARVATHMQIQHMRRQLQQQNEYLQQEIQRRKETEQALRESQNFITRVTETIPFLVYVYDLSHHEFTYRNRSFATLFDCLVGKNDTQIDEYISHHISMDDQPLVLAYMQKLSSATSNQLFECEYRIQHDDATWRWLHHYDAIFTWLPDGQPGQIIGTVIDITEQRKNSQLVQEQENALTILQERERLTRELHDTHGQVLGAINSQSQTLQELLNQGQAILAQPMLDSIIEMTQQAQKDVRDVILGTRSSIELYTRDGKEQNFVAALQTFCLGLTQSYGFHTMLHITEAVENMSYSPLVAVQLLRIAQESLTNIRKHAGVTKAKLTMSCTDTALEMQIEDNGSGFDISQWYGNHTESQHMPRYGLYSIRGRAEDLGGRVTINSIIGKGTTVHVWIPLQEAQMELSQGNLDYRILLVDDNTLFVQSLHRLLTAYRLHVVGMSSNGEKALQQTRQLQPNIILMDIDMPTMGGLEATRLIKAEYPDIHIVMLTVSADDEHLFEAIKYGASGYLTKDLHAEQLISLLLGLSLGEVPLSPGMASRILQEFASQEVSAKQPDEVMISNFQQELLTLVASGYTYRQVGYKLNYSEQSIRYHMGVVIKKLHLKNRADAVAYVQQRVAQGAWDIPLELM